MRTQRTHPKHKPPNDLFGAVVLSLAIVFSLGCITGEPQIQLSECTPGETQECACEDGRSGAQTCAADGSYAPCVCTDPSTPDVDMGEVDMNTGSPDMGTPPDMNNDPESASYRIEAQAVAAPPAEKAASSTFELVGGVERPFGRTAGESVSFELEGSVRVRTRAESAAGGQ